MTPLDLLKAEVCKYQYFEDTDVIDVSLAANIATRLKLGDPIWMVIIGASSGGKSQILRPMSLTDPKFLHRVDDLTENTFLSGMRAKKGDTEPSLLHRIGVKGMLVMSDLTVLFSKASESRGAILSQFRMIYDGEMTKFSGASSEPLTWKGYLGILAGSTPSIYAHFEEVADMGERFIYYRMKDYNPEKATRLALTRGKFGKDLDDILSGLYAEYVKSVVSNWGDKAVVLPQEFQDHIIKAAVFAEKIRTPIVMDFQKKDTIRKPITAMPMRVALQLTSLVNGLYVMRGGELNDSDLNIVSWCGWSLANEEKRGVLSILGRSDFESGVTTQAVADVLGLSTTVTGSILQNLSAVKVLQRSGDGTGSLRWYIKDRSDWELVRKIEGIKSEDSVVYNERELSHEEQDEVDRVAEATWNMFENEKQIK